MSDVAWETVEASTKVGNYSLTVSAPCNSIGSEGTKWYWLVWLGPTDKPGGECRYGYCDSEAEAKAAAIACALAKPKRVTS